MEIDFCRKPEGAIARERDGSNERERARQNRTLPQIFIFQLSLPQLSPLVPRLIFAFRLQPSSFALQAREPYNIFFILD